MHNLLILIILFCLMPGLAQAQAKIGWPLGWFPSHTEWTDYKKFNPYLENGQHPHPEQWQKDDWRPQDWIQQRKTGLDLIQGFYRADIIRDQDIVDNVPVVTVGPNFYHLGGQDKRRVIASINDVYGVTAQREDGTILLKDWHTRMEIGLFTKHGLTIQ